MSTPRLLSQQFVFLQVFGWKDNLPGRYLSFVAAKDNTISYSHLCPVPFTKLSQVPYTCIRCLSCHLRRVHQNKVFLSSPLSNYQLSNFTPEVSTEVSSLYSINWCGCWSSSMQSPSPTTSRDRERHRSGSEEPSGAVWLPTTQLGTRFKKRTSEFLSSELKNITTTKWQKKVWLDQYYFF